MKLKNISFFDKLKSGLGGKFGNKFKNPSVKYKVFSNIKVIFAVTLLISLNIGAYILTEKFSLKADLTKNKVFSLTEDSIKYVSSLDKDIEIIVLNDRDKFLENDDYFKQSDNVINEYSRYSDKINIKYIDINENPNIKAEYADENVTENSIIVKSGTNHKILSAQDLFNIERSPMGGASITSSKAEQAMTSAIIGVTSENKIKLDMITGFDELEAHDFVNMLEYNNYEIASVPILTNDLSTDSSGAFIFAPNRDYDKEAIVKIKNYLENNGEYGKNLIYFINSGQKILPRIAEFVKDWGIGINKGWVFEPDITKRLIADHGLYTLCQYEYNSEYTNLVKNETIPVAMPASKPLEILDKDKAETLLSFSATSGVYPEDAPDNWQPSEKDMNKGPIPGLIISTKKNEETGKKSTLVVIGSMTAVDEIFLSRNSLNNSSYFLNLINKLTEKGETVNIEPKTMGISDMYIEGSMAMAIGIIFVIAVPIGALLVGVAVWLIKRKK